MAIQARRRSRTDRKSESWPVLGTLRARRVTKLRLDRLRKPSRTTVNLILERYGIHMCNKPTASTSSAETSHQPVPQQPYEAPRLVGYVRVSTDDQNLSLQIDALTKHGISKPQIFMDKLSGAQSDRPGLNKCLETLQKGDILVVGSNKITCAV